VLSAACDALHELHPDVLLLGGDFVTVRASYIHDLAARLADLQAPLGKFAVFGNHDLRANRSVLERALAGAGVTVLNNDVVRLAAPHDDVTIAGLDDPIRGLPRGEILDEMTAVRIVLMHAPDGLLAVGDRRYDLAVCGHTHGGQIALPGGLMPYLPSGKLSREYPVGLFRLGPDGDRALLVSRGVGCSTVPIRLRSPAQVHLFTIG
jgi:predicted MPP superfamily phosphohydrolase